MLCTDDDKFYMFYNHGITSANCIDKHFLSLMYLKCICINLYDIFCSRLPHKVVYMTSKFGLKRHVIHYREGVLQNGKIKGPKLFVLPPPRDIVKYFVTPFIGVETTSKLFVPTLHHD